jgi:hypothetical protein
MRRSCGDGVTGPRLYRQALVSLPDTGATNTAAGDGY